MKKNLIYDIGMYDGLDTEHYLSKGYNVIAVEADPTLAEKARKKFIKFVNSGKLTIVNAGVSENKGTANFYISEVRPFWNSFDEKITGRDGLPYHKIEIPCVRFEDLLSEHGVPYYLKIDIEGSDIFCLKALNKNDLPFFLSFEADNHGDTEMLDILRDLGYKKFKCISQNTFLSISVPYEKSHDIKNMPFKDVFFLKVMYGKNIVFKVLRKLNGRSIFKSLLKPAPHLSYRISTSGPFGEDLSGEWLSYEKIKQLYLQSYESYKKDVNNTDYGFWCDFHASL